MGSHSENKLHHSYIAGFLDGDGSLMLQIKKRKDTENGKRFMCTICFYQDSRHEKPLSWIRKILRTGYIARRNDGMTELRINGFRQVRDIIAKLLPFIRFKKIQAKALHKAATILAVKKIKKLTRNELLKIIDCIVIMQSNNYASRKKKNKQEMMKMFGVTP